MVSVPFEERFAQIENLSPEELRNELQSYRNMWTWIPPDVQYLLVHIGSSIGLISRNYKVSRGELVGFKVKLEEVHIHVSEVVFDYEHGGHFWEDKVLQVPMSNIVSMEFIAERKPTAAPVFQSKNGGLEPETVTGEV